MERGNYDIDEIPLVMNIRSYMFEPLAVNNNEENTLTSSDDSEAYTSRYTQVFCMTSPCDTNVRYKVI